MTKILVTGGAGYIGSFIVRQLKTDGYTPVIIDNFSAGHREAISEFEVHEIDLVTEKGKLDKFFDENSDIEGVIHMASLIQAGESYRNPILYFDHNLKGAINLFNSMIEHDIKKLVLSSTAAVYGTPDTTPIREDFAKHPENPYGETKLQTEQILKWLDTAHEFKSICVRYFNAAGAALDGSIGEDHPGESHIIPLMIKSAIENREFTIFGDDYNTPDGTCIRDYIHVLDLARAHTLAIKKLLEGGESNYYNCGTGNGYSNMQLIQEVRNQLGEFEYKIGERRMGDPDELVADSTKLQNELGWNPEYGLSEIISSAIAWHKKNPQGYEK